MKKIAILLITFLPVATMAQKETKPSSIKAEKLLRDGKLDEAKALIDLTVESREFMYDKKGKHSRNAANAWYIRALVYASIDTTKNEKYKSLVADPYLAEVASFDSCQAIDKGKTPSFIKDQKGFLPLTTDQVNSQIAQRYLTTSLDAYTKEKNYKKAFNYMERVLYFIPTDTSMLMNAGIYMGPAAEDFDKSIVYMNRYLEKGGRNQDAYLQLVSIYVNKKKDDESALKLLRDARIKYPDNVEFPKQELNIYLAEKKYVLARKSIQADIRKNPDQKENVYLLGQLNEELGNLDSAKIAYQRCVAIDPQYFDAYLKLAKLYFADGRRIKTERDKLGISAQDKEKRLKLLMNLRTEYQTALPYWEKCESLRPDNETVLVNLREIYASLVMDEQFDRVNKKIKALGYDN